MTWARSFRPLLLAGLGALTGWTALGCTGEGASGSNDEDLTSLTARQRVLTFEGLVYVAPGSTTEVILEAVHRQTQSAFGALMHSNVAVQTRELQNVDAHSLEKREVTMIDVADPDAPGIPKLEVRYTYRDNAVVPVEMARRSSLAAAVLSPDYALRIDDVVAACTKNDKEARADAANGLLWYDFDPTTSRCKKAIEAEQRAIDADTAKLEDPRRTVSASRAERLYLPITMSLARAETASTATYPEYDRLFAGGAQEGALTVVLLAGRLAHDRVEAKKDGGYWEWLRALDMVFADHPEFMLTKIEPELDLGRIDVSGRTYAASFTDIINWTIYRSGWPRGLPTADRDAIESKVASALDNHWLTFEKKVKVTIGDAPEHDLTIRIETLFGAEDDPAPHTRALSRGDVVVYNGHSYIGYGPLDPANYSTASFPRESYQLFFFDSCVSYNYYEKDFFTLKSGGSKNLDLVTNGLEAPEWMSGEAEGRFLSRLLDGSMPSYQTLLREAIATDSLRVVDGEIDNRFSPSRTRIRVSVPGASPASSRGN